MRPCFYSHAELRPDSCRLCKLYTTDPRYQALWDDQPVPPGLLQKAGNFARSVASYVAAGLPQVSEEEYQRRIAICQACAFLKNNTCLKCGCNVIGNVLTKSRWQTESCPLKLW